MGAFSVKATLTFLFACQIRGGIEDNSKIFFLNENICCDPSLELSWQDGSNEGSQNRFLQTNVANYP